MPRELKQWSFPENAQVEMKKEMNGMATLCALLTSKSSSSSSSLDPKISLISSPAPPVGLKCPKYEILNQQSSFYWQTIFQRTSSRTITMIKIVLKVVD